MKWLNKSKKSSQFDIWISQYHGALYKHAMWMTGSRDVAQDMVQEAFFQAWLAIDSIKDNDKVLPWLLTILRRTVYREHRFQYRHAETLAELRQMEQAEQLQPPKVQTDVCTLLEIYDALGILSTKLRDTFLLYQLHGFSYKEIGEQLQIAEGTVMSRIARAREILKKYQGRNGENVIELKRLNQVHKKEVRNDE